MEARNLNKNEKSVAKLKNGHKPICDAFTITIFYGKCTLFNTVSVGSIGVTSRLTTNKSRVVPKSKT